MQPRKAHVQPESRVAVEAEGLGCNLQHHQGMMGKEMNAEWNISETWQAKAQLVFGQSLSGPLLDKEKTFRPIEDCIKIYGRQIHYRGTAMYLYPEV